MQKYDVKEAYPALYSPKGDSFSETVVPPLQYLAVDGEGDPNTAPAYAAAIEALYSTSYTLKFQSKAQGHDYVVGPLEALWTAADPADFVTRTKSSWKWTALINQPEWITADDVDSALATLAVKKPNPALSLARLHDEYLPQNGLTFNGLHHEVYLSDARRTAPERLRTVLRQPVRAVPTARVP
jgi:hypothetical protein